MRQTEHVLYITLIDFLLQLLFLGMVISVVYAIAQREAQDALPDPIEAKKAIEDLKSIQEEMKKVKQLTGVSDLTELTDELTRLGPLNQAKKNSEDWKKISKEVHEIGGVDTARKALAKQVAKKAGEGLPSCLPNKARLATFHAYPDHIELQDFNDKEFPVVLSKLGTSKEGVANLNNDSFRRIFEPVKSAYPECRFYVRVIEHSFDTRPRDAVRAAFMAVNEPAPDRH